MERDERNDQDLRPLLLHLSTGQDRAQITCRTAATLTHSEETVGSHIIGFHRRIASVGWLRRDLGRRRQVLEVRTFPAAEAPVHSLASRNSVHAGHIQAARLANGHHL